MTFTFIFINRQKNNKERNFVQNPNMEGKFEVWLLLHRASISLVGVPSCTLQKEQCAGRHRQSKGPEVGTCLECLKNSEEAEKSQVVPDGDKPCKSP